ncbi:hypothetical protein DIPPA_60410 [Diplonema papillatum]|nr:hypothetical protein DIPPA_60410 [Diplonema papillatum]
MANPAAARRYEVLLAEEPVGIDFIEDYTGVEVSSVKPNSPAARALVPVGPVVAVNGAAVRTISELISIVNECKRRGDTRISFDVVDEGPPLPPLIVPSRLKHFAKGGRLQYVRAFDKINSRNNREPRVLCLSLNFLALCTPEANVKRIVKMDQIKEVINKERNGIFQTLIKCHKPEHDLLLQHTNSRWNDTTGSKEEVDRLCGALSAVYQHETGAPLQLHWSTTPAPLFTSANLVKDARWQPPTLSVANNTQSLRYKKPPGDPSSPSPASFNPAANYPVAALSSQSATTAPPPPPSFYDRFPHPGATDGKFQPRSSYPAGRNSFPPVLPPPPPEEPPSDIPFYSLQNKKPVDGNPLPPPPDSPVSERGGRGFLLPPPPVQMSERGGRGVLLPPPPAVQLHSTRDSHVVAHDTTRLTSPQVSAEENDRGRNHLSTEVVHSPAPSQLTEGADGNGNINKPSTTSTARSGREELAAFLHRAADDPTHPSHVESASDLGHKLLRGDWGYALNPEEGLHYLRIAANGGDYRSQRTLDVLLRKTARKRGQPTTRTEHRDAMTGPKWRVSNRRLKRTTGRRSTDSDSTRSQSHSPGAAPPAVVTRSLGPNKKKRSASRSASPGRIRTLIRPGDTLTMTVEVNIDGIPTSVQSAGGTPIPKDQIRSLPSAARSFDFSTCYSEI